MPEPSTAPPATTPPSPIPAPPRRPGRLVAWLLFPSLLLNAALIGYEARRIHRRGGLRYIKEQLDLQDVQPIRVDFQKEWDERVRKLPVIPGGVIFAGDSLVAGGPWSEVFTDLQNRGIGGETTAGLLGRLDSLVASTPRKLFLLVGTNDLATDVPVTQLVRNLGTILERFRDESPGTRVYVLSLLPVNQSYPGGPIHDNATIRDVNRRLRELVGAFGNAEYLDVHEALAGPDGALLPAYTTDGLHLSFDGYLRLCEILGTRVRDDDRPGADARKTRHP